MINRQSHPITIGIDASRAFVEDPAGPEYYSWHLIKNLSIIDKENNYILYLRPGQKPDFKLPRNFTFKTINMRYLWTQIGLAFELILHPADILFIPAHTLPLVCKVLLPQMPIVVTVHGLEGKYLPQSGSILAHIYRNWSITWAVRMASNLIAVSEDTRSDVINTYHINSKDITTIHEGVDVEKYRNAKKLPKNSQYYSTRKYILFVGTIQPRKNLVKLIKAFSKLSDRGINLVIVGKLGWLYQRVLKAPKKYRVDNRVLFTGRVKDESLVGLYKGAELFCLPSITEGFGLPILEAQAADIPVVSSTGGALPEIAGKGAFYINPTSVESIRDGLEKVLEDFKLRHELVSKGRENVSNFSWIKTADNTLNFLLKAYNRKD